MKECAIIVETQSGNIILPVKDFSKENVLSTIEKQFKIPVNEITELTASMTGSICGMKDKKLFKQSEIKGIKLQNSEFSNMFEVKYGYIINQ